MPDRADFEILVDTITEQLSDPSLEHHLFHSAPSATSPRQVAWIPTKFKNHERLTRFNPSFGTDVPEVLYVEPLIVEVHHHGTDFADCCDIRARVANAVHDVMGPESAPLDGFYEVAPEKDAPATEWTSESVIVQRYIWNMPIRRLDEAEFPASVTKVAFVDGTQITTTEAGVLTLTEQLEIKE